MEDFIDHENESEIYGKDLIRNQDQPSGQQINQAVNPPSKFKNQDKNYNLKLYEPLSRKSP